jgi:hypothetical protein
VYHGAQLSGVPRQDDLSVYAPGLGQNPGDRYQRLGLGGLAALVDEDVAEEVPGASPVDQSRCGHQSTHHDSVLVEVGRLPRTVLALLVIGVLLDRDEPGGAGHTGGGESQQIRLRDRVNQSPRHLVGGAVSRRTNQHVPFGVLVDLLDGLDDRHGLAGAGWTKNQIRRRHCSFLQYGTHGLLLLGVVDDVAIEPLQRDLRDRIPPHTFGEQEMTYVVHPGELHRLVLNFQRVAVEAEVDVELLPGREDRLQETKLSIRLFRNKSLHYLTGWKTSTTPKLL